MSSKNTKQLSIDDSIAFCWGLAEAIFFFIVPDVFITYRGIKGSREVVRASLGVTVGAIIGGIIMYKWASGGSAAADFVLHVPAVSGKMLAQIQSSYTAHGALTIFQAMVLGIPYKVLAVIAPGQGVGLVIFIVVSILARLSRFLVAGLIVVCLSKLLSRWLSYRRRLLILIIFWIVFYIFYFNYMGNTR